MCMCVCVCVKRWLPFPVVSDGWMITKYFQHSNIQIMHPTESLGNIFCVMPSTSQLMSRVISESDASANKQMQSIKKAIVFN